MELDREESYYDYLARRKRELTHQIAALRGQIEPKELELAHIEAAEKILGNFGGADKTRLGFPQKPTTRLADVNAEEPHVEQVPPAPIPIPSPYESMTIKALVVQALLDNFPDGATTTQLRSFVRDAYRRVIEQSSLRSQIHRLKADSVLEHDPSADTWNLTKDKRRAYTLFDHPTSRKAMKELKDNAPTND